MQTLLQTIRSTKRILLKPFNPSRKKFLTKIIESPLVYSTLCTEITLRTNLIGVVVSVIEYAPFIFIVYVNTDPAGRTTIWPQMIFRAGTVSPNNWGSIIIDEAICILIPFILGLA